LGLRAEVEQQSNLQHARSEVIQELGFMDRLESSTGFKLNNDHSTHDQICLELAYCFTAKTRTKRELLIYLESCLPQSNSHGLTVHRLHKAITQLIVNLKEHTDDELGNLLVFVSAFICGLKDRLTNLALLTNFVVSVKF
jgi:hypothetical protein